MSEIMKSDVTWVATIQELPNAKMTLTIELKDMADDAEGTKASVGQQLTELAAKVAFGWFAYGTGAFMDGEAAFFGFMADYLKAKDEMNIKTQGLARRAQAVDQALPQGEQQ